MKSAMLVDVHYLAMLEHLHEELHQARLAESVVMARRHLLAALAVSEEVSCMLEGS